tara:strand:- start:10794 stop:12629 length:1836 start_codon:yes stop_codon:yes gene_type:complete
MCGFLGQINLSYNQNNKYEFIKSARLISHRGPDDNSYYFEKNLFLSFFRLSIRDLSLNGRQPMLSRNKRYLMCFNGEIYNSPYLTKKYLNKNDLKSSSDTEVLLECFSKKNCAIFNELEGMFAFFIYDLKNKYFYLCRDRFGIKPLYYAVDKEKIIFGSEIKPILKLQKKPNFQIDAFSDFFLKGCLDHNKTFFKSVETLEPGSYLKIKRDLSFSKKKYWNLTDHLCTDGFSNSKNKLKDLFENSIKKHLISDRKIGIFLSGGTDSTLITECAKKYSSNNFDTFTYDFKGDSKFSEKKNALEVSKKLNLKNFLSTVSPEYVIKNFDYLIESIESPITSLRLFGVLKNYQSAKEKNYKVIIEGHGGDEQFAGYQYNYIFYQLEMYKKHKNKNKLMELLFFNKNYKNLTENDILNTIITTTFQNGSTTDGTPFINVNLLNKDFLNHVVSEKYYFQKKLSKNLLKNSQLLDIKDLKLPRVLKYTDRLSMINGIETRVPFLDHRLFEYSFNLQENLKFRDNQSRWIFKKIYQKTRLPLKNKRSIVDPQTDWFKKELKELFWSEINSTNFKNSEFFDHKFVKKYYESFLKKKNETSFNLIQILSTQIFLKKFSNFF